MHRLIYYVFIFFLILITHLGSCADTTSVISIVEEDNNLDSNDISNTILTTKTTTTPTIIIESSVEDIVEDIVVDTVDKVTESTTTITTTTIINEKQVKNFLTEYSINVNLSSLSLSNVIFNSYLNDLLVLVLNEHEILLINKTDGTLRNHLKYAHIIPVNQQKEQSNFLVIFDDNTQELWILNSTHQENPKIHFKPKQIYIFSSANNLWIAETSDEVGLYTSQNSGIDWKQVEQSSSSSVLGWSNKAQAVVIIQHSRYIKLLDITTDNITPILNDVSSTKLFSRYLLTKQSNDAIVTGHVNNLADEIFRPLPKRLQSQGNFYCAIEDINTQDLLLLFITDNRLTENNETILSTCNLISHSKQGLFNLSNINCESINNDNSLKPIECSREQIPFYQVHGLSKSVFLANIAPEATTVVSFDGGITWNKTHYECNKMINCPNNVSVVIKSLSSSNAAPGIVVGKASDGVNEYVAISPNGGRLWRLSLKGNGYLTALSNPNALIVTIPNPNQQSTNHSYLYSTDYGRSWHSGTFSNETSFQILSLIANDNNIFHILTLNNENQLNLIQLDFNLLIVEQCARHQLKEWSLHGACINGSKLFYKRRISGSHCLDNASHVRIEPCACTLSDFQCSSDYRRSKDGICLPKSHYIFTQDCTCNDNSTLLTKRRGYIKSINSQCNNGIENYLSDVQITRRDPNHPNFFVYGIDSRTKKSIVEIHTNDFDDNIDDDDNDDDDDDDDNEVVIQNTTWFIDETYEITGLVFDENGKQVYIAVEHDESSIIYSIGKNLRQQNRDTKRLTFDSNNELYKSTDEHIEYITLDKLAQNLYVLIRNKKTQQQTIFILNIRTHKRRTIIKNQRIQPSIILVDPIKTNLYWISHNSPLTLNIGNLQGQIKKYIRLSSIDSNISYISYDSVTHEIIFVINSTIYGLNTLDYHHHVPRIIYEHSSIIQNPLFIHPILYFTHQNNNTDSSAIHLQSVDILAKSFAKKITKFKNFNSLKLFVDMAPSIPISSTTINHCTNNPCSDLCIPLEHGRFRCLCSDDARYQTCSCPSGERFIAGGCQAKNEQCAPGRILCQNRLNCAESARMCEQDHTQYTEAFKTTARCTLDKPNDGFDCYYTGTELSNANHTCIPFEWLCDGFYDCPLGNDEEHCHKITTTTRTLTRDPSRCLTEKRFTHIMCGDKCMKIKDICRNVSNAVLCSDQFHLNCKQTHDKNQYICKCRNNKNQCITMIENCDDFERCEQICQESIHYATSKSNTLDAVSSKIWIILAIVIFIILLIAIIFMTLRYMRGKNAKKAPAQSRTPAAPTIITTNSSPSDAQQQLLNQGTNTANETS
ncbi:unnamed protein product [Rotaria sordida]|uniref:VPS10 domain-containing protein n=1 Tax=Rotaria sordida TaxID=392033 RepID=A0A813R8T9_9BILA|nr:unnamed protein product [Rotaria sordida]CAF3568321.1 unnamed protein product [Rotaria sordida]